MELTLKDTNDKLLISESIFGQNFNKALVHQVIVAYANNARHGTSAQKTKGEVAGSGRKPWRQKGTGRARAGSVKSPIWRSGSVAFAARPQDYSQKINKKMYRGALRSILSELIRQDRLFVVEKFLLNSPKTKMLAQKLKAMTLKNVMIITNNRKDNLYLAARNLFRVDVRHVTNIDPISLINFDKIVITVDAIKQIEEMLE